MARCLDCLTIEGVLYCPHNCKREEDMRYAFAQAVAQAVSHMHDHHPSSILGSIERHTKTLRCPQGLTPVSTHCPMPHICAVEGCKGKRPNTED